MHRELGAQIDSQLETMAASIIASNLSTELLENFEKTDDIIRDALEDQRIDRTIRIFSKEGRLLFSNDMGEYIESEMSLNRWDTIEAVDRKLRILTLETNGYSLEIGVFAEPLLKQFNFNSRVAIAIFSLILLLLTGISFVVARLSISPFQRLHNSFLLLKNKVISEKSFYDSEGSLKIEDLKKFTSQKDEIGELARELVALFEHLFEIRRAYQKDLYFLAHELKTPLAKMVGFAESLQYDKAKSEELSGRIKNLCKNMAGYIDDYLQIAAVRSQFREKLKLEALNLGPFITELITQQYPEEKSRIRWQEPKISPTIFAEAFHLRSTLTNLIDNALKYSEGSVEIAIDSQSLRILDDGPGVPADNLSRLGEAFNKSNRPDSSGLGLAFVKSLTDLYGWKLDYSRIDQRTQFAISFDPR